MREIKLEQILYAIEDFQIKKHIVIGIYSLEKVRQSRDDYFFNARKQLVATIGENSKADYKAFIETGIFPAVIEKWRFRPLDEAFERLYITLDEAELALKKQKEFRIEREVESMNDLRREIDKMQEELECKEKSFLTPSPA